MYFCFEIFVVLLPVFMERIEKKAFMIKYGKYIYAPLQIGLAGLR